MAFNFGNSAFMGGPSPFGAAGAGTQSPWQTNTLGPTPCQPIVVTTPLQTPSGQPYPPLNPIFGGQGQPFPIFPNFQGSFPQSNPSFVPGGGQINQFHSQGSYGPLTNPNPMGQSTLAMDQLRRSGINNFVGVPQGQAQLFYPNSNEAFGQQTRFQAHPPSFSFGPRWPDPVFQGQGLRSQSGFPMVSGKFALIDTGALSKLLQDHARSVQQIPPQRPLNRFDSLRSELSGPSSNFCGPSGFGQYNHVSPQRNPLYQPVDWTQGQRQPSQSSPRYQPVDWTQGQGQPSQINPRYQAVDWNQGQRQPTGLLGTREGQEYFVDLVQDVGQFRRGAPQTQHWSAPPNRTGPTSGITVPRHVQRGATYQPPYHDPNKNSGPNARFHRPGHTFSFKPTPESVQVRTPGSDWKKLNLKSVDSMIDPMDEPLVDMSQRRTFSDYGRQYHNPNAPKTAEASGPPRQSGASSFSNLVQARMGVPVPFPIRNLSFKPQRDNEYVANLSHRVSQLNMARHNLSPTFNPFLPEERPVQSPPAPEAGNVELKEIFRKAKPFQQSKIPIPTRNLDATVGAAEVNADDDGWVSVRQGKVNQIPRRHRNSIDLDIGKTSILEKAVTFNVNPLETRKANRTRSRRARSKMTYSTQERNRCKVILKRDQYYCRPDIDELDALMDDDGHCLVTNFEVGHLEWGKVIFEGTFDVAGINLDTAIDIMHKAVVLRREAEGFPPVGQGLNRPATVYLHKVWYNNPLTKQEIRDPTKLKAMDFEQTLKESIKHTEAEFVNYDAEKGDWTFKVPYFVPIAAKLPSKSESGDPKLDTTI